MLWLAKTVPEVVIGKGAGRRRKGFCGLDDVMQRSLSSRQRVHIREGVMSALNDPVWYISRDDHRHGPYSADEFARFEEAGRLRPTDQVWQTGMDAWIDYNDYIARESVARSERPHRPSASGLAGMRTLTAALTTALQGVPTLLAKIRSVLHLHPCRTPRNTFLKEPLACPLIRIPRRCIPRCSGHRNQV